MRSSILFYVLLSTLFQPISSVIPEAYRIPTTASRSTTKPYEIFLKNSFPADLSTIHGYNISNETVYEDIVDMRIGIPMYAGLDEVRNKKILVESFFTNFRTKDSTTFVATSPEICRARSNASTLIPNSSRIVSIFHEINLPFQVSCSSCSHSNLKNYSPKFFRILQNRKVYSTPGQLLNDSISIPDYLRDKMHQTSPASIYAIERYSQANRSGLSFSPRIIPQFSKENIESDPSTKIAENAVSVICSKETERGKLVPLDVIFNVDTVRIPPPKSNVLDDKNEPDPADLLHRLKIEDLVVFTETISKQLPIISEKLNLKLDVRWEPWSCCTACCCSPITCGKGFDTSEAACKETPSFKSKRGFVSFFKNDPLSPLLLSDQIEAFIRTNPTISTDLASETVKAAEMIDVYLSSDPYSYLGISFHSTLLQSSRAFLIVEAFLNQNFKYRDETSPENGMFGRYGLLIQSKSCDEDRQKTNCSLLQQCQESGGYDLTDTGDDGNPENEQENEEMSHPKRQQVCPFPGIEDVEIKDRESAIVVHESLSYRFSIDQEEFGELLSTEWDIGQRDAPEFDKEKACSQQRVFVDGSELTVLKMQKEDSMQPYIARGIVKHTGEEVVLKMVLNFRAKSTSSKYTSQLLKWVGISGGVLFSFIGTVIVIHCIQVRSLNKKLEEIRKNVTKSTELPAQ